MVARRFVSADRIADATRTSTAAPSVGPRGTAEGVAGPGPDPPTAVGEDGRVPDGESGEGPDEGVDGNKEGSVCTDIGTPTVPEDGTAISGGR
jgi:hypothetical protein